MELINDCLNSAPVMNVRDHLVSAKFWDIRNAAALPLAILALFLANLLASCHRDGIYDDPSEEKIQLKMFFWDDLDSPPESSTHASNGCCCFHYNDSGAAQKKKQKK